MHPFALYLVATDAQREQRTTNHHERRGFAAVDAPPLPAAAKRSRVERMTAILRRRAAPATGA